MNKQRRIEAMANSICEMANKPDSCEQCPGRKGGCFTLPKMDKLIHNGYGAAFDLKLLRALEAFKGYFDSLYGEGLEVANWHQNGNAEPFDSFYDAAMDEYNKIIEEDGK